MYVFDETRDFEKRENKLLTQGIYDIKEFSTEDGRPFLVFAQHFGNIEVLNKDLKLELSVKPEKINTIFHLVKLSNKKQEFGLCAYNGFYFVKFKELPSSKLELVILQESYLPDRCV